MKKTKREKTYKSPETYMILFFLIVIALFAFISALIQKDYKITSIEDFLDSLDFATIATIAAFMAIMQSMMMSFFNASITNNSFVDIKVCDYQHLLSKNVYTVWRAPVDAHLTELKEKRFIEIRNSGEAMFSYVSLIINHEKNKNYTIRYPIRKDESVYLTVPGNTCLQNVSVIYQSSVSTKGTSFSGSLI